LFSFPNLIESLAVFINYCRGLKVWSFILEKQLMFKKNHGRIIDIGNFPCIWK